MHLSEVSLSFDFAVPHDTLGRSFPSFQNRLDTALCFLRTPFRFRNNLDNLDWVSHYLPHTSCISSSGLAASGRLSLLFPHISGKEPRRTHGTYYIELRHRSL